MARTSVAFRNVPKAGFARRMVAFERVEIGRRGVKLYHRMRIAPGQRVVNQGTKQIIVGRRLGRDDDRERVFLGAGRGLEGLE